MVANKKKILTDVELFYIQNNPENLSASALSYRLNVQLAKVEEILAEQEKLRAEEAEEAEAIKLEMAKREPTLLRKMITPSEGKNKVSVMSESASEVLDAANKNARAKVRGVDQSGHIVPTFPTGR